MCDQRVGELILLDSMFPKQCQWDDPSVGQAVSEQDYEFVYGKALEFTFQCDKHLDIICTLGVDYPKTTTLSGNGIHVHCRVLDGRLSNSVQKTLNDRVGDYLSSSNNGSTDTDTGLDYDIISVIQKIQELWTDLDSIKLLANNTSSYNCPANGGDHASNDTNQTLGGNNNDDDVEDRDAGISRYWIYSHHIKSTKKRQLIIDLARELHLTGFTCVGKPGFICVEGGHRYCEQFWQQIRSLSWQRITLIDTERHLPTAPGGSSDGCGLAFVDYHELADTAHMFRLLEANKCDSVVKNFLGFTTN
ncbi:RWD domain-containing protein 2B-like [Oppia nitens]|uniref:RWD domain-containing protein 2B-like n=1 Tax=Oppia nitens TaxID=1686743 RepID=UPI0023DCBC16|nr:RWD domain-containing protein 2B-like [Oppia nitens]